MKISLILFCILIPLAVFCSEEDAIIGLTAVLENDPSDTMSRLQRAEAYYKQGKNKDCISDLKTVLEACQSKKVFVVFAKICEEDKNWNSLLQGCEIMENAGAEINIYQNIKELATCGKAVDENPNDIESRKNLGKIYGKMNKVQQASEEFEKVLEKDNYDTSAILYLAQCYEFLEKEELASGIYKRYYDLTRDEKILTKLKKLEKKSIFRDDFNREELGDEWQDTGCYIEGGKLIGSEAILKRDLRGDVGIEFDWILYKNPKSGIMVELFGGMEYFGICWVYESWTYIITDNNAGLGKYPRVVLDYVKNPSQKKYRICLIKKGKNFSMIIDGKQTLEAKAEKAQPDNRIVFRMHPGNAIDNVRIFKP